MNSSRSAAIAYQEFWKRKRRMEPGVAFVVLTVAETEAQTTSLQETALDADPRGRGLNLFYFTTCGSWNMEQPESFSLGRIWNTAAGEQRPLLA